MLLTAYFHPYEYAKEIVLRHLNKNEIHLWAQRPEKFEPEDRSHNEQESKEIDVEMSDFLKSCGVTVSFIKGSPNQRLNQVLEILKKRGLI
jgi:hypothetical protein